MYKQFFKRVIDLLIAFVVLMLISPFLLAIVILLHFANKGSGVFFFQERPGKNEKIFKVIKFKSMTDKKDKNGHLLPDSQRITRIGKIIRKTSIDELPQLINVLKGDMSLIGPRPLLPQYLPYYTDREKMRHFVRPGITGLAQVQGRNNLDWNTKLEIDVCYVEKLTFRLDLKVFFLTLYKVLKREGVIADKKENYLNIERQNTK